MTKIIIPRGYIWLKDAAQDFKWRYTEIKIHLGLDHNNQKDFEHTSFYESLARFQIALVNADMTAMYFGEEDLLQVPRGFWARDDREEFISRGMLAYKSDEEMPIFVEMDLYKKFVSWHETLANMPGTTMQAIEGNQQSLYVTPFIDLMFKAIAYFNISETDAPKIDTIKDWLREQKLPNEKSLSENQITSMATFCRPPDRMAGGNAKTRTPVKK